MATAKYTVEYEDGRKRIKLLSSEDADRMKEQDTGIKSITRVRDKSRSAEGQKDEDNPNADEKRTRKANERKTDAANENREQ